jgi:hypothetical protein
MKTYKKIETPFNDVIKFEDNSIITYIPIDAANSDYQEYLKYLEDNKK